MPIRTLIAPISSSSTARYEPHCFLTGDPIGSWCKYSLYVCHHCYKYLATQSVITRLAVLSILQPRDTMYWHCRSIPLLPTIVAELQRMISFRWAGDLNPELWMDCIETLKQLAIFTRVLRRMTMGSTSLAWSLHTSRAYCGQTPASFWRWYRGIVPSQLNNNYQLPTCDDCVALAARCVREYCLMG